jgi:hypothetical protein
MWTALDSNPELRFRGRWQTSWTITPLWGVNCELFLEVGCYVAENMYLRERNYSFHALGKICWVFVRKCAVQVNVEFYLRWHRTVAFYQTSVYLFEQHVPTDIAYWFLFSSTTLFGRLFQPSSDRNTGSQKRLKKRERDPSLRIVGIRLDYCKNFFYCYEKGKVSNIKIDMLHCFTVHFHSMSLLVPTNALF